MQIKHFLPKFIEWNIKNTKTQGTQVWSFRNPNPFFSKNPGTQPGLGTQVKTLFLNCAILPYIYCFRFFKCQWGQRYNSSSAIVRLLAFFQAEKIHPEVIQEFVLCLSRPRFSGIQILWRGCPRNRSGHAGQPEGLWGHARGQFEPE